MHEEILQCNSAPIQHHRPNSPRTFYLILSLLMLVLVTGAFSRTVGAGLLHTQHSPRFVALLAFHGVVFYAWMLFFVVQSALIQVRNLRLHRLLGWFGRHLDG